MNRKDRESTMKVAEEDIEIFLLLVHRGWKKFYKSKTNSKNAQVMGLGIDISDIIVI